MDEYKQYECDHRFTNPEKTKCLKCGAVYNEDLMEWVRDLYDDMFEKGEYD